MRIAKPFWKETHKCWYVKKKGKHVRLDPDKKEAQKLWKQMLGAEGDPEAAIEDSPLLRVSDVIDQFLSWSLKNQAAATHKHYNKFLADFKGRNPMLRLNKLKNKHVTDWLDSDYFAGSGQTVKYQGVTALKRAINFLKDQQVIAANPISGYKRPTPNSRGEGAYIEPEKWEELVTAIHSSHQKNAVGPFLDYITVMKDTGCRPQEIRAVEARHLDKKRRVWVFPKEEAKGKKVERVVHLTDRAYTISCKLAMKYPEGALFRNADGKQWSNFALSCRFARLEAKVGFRVCPYSIRHTFATDAILRGVDLMHLKELMGHADLTMLTKIYQHIKRRSSSLKDALSKATGEQTAASEETPTLPEKKAS